MGYARAAFVASVVGLFALTATSAMAQTPTRAAQAASKRFAAAERAFERGDYLLAADEFEAAYALSPHSDSLWNAARSAKQAHQFARAANLYAKYLREAAANAPDRNSANAALVTLSAKLGRLEVHAIDAEDLRVDESEVEAGVVFVTPGQHAVRARREDHELTEVVSVKAGEIVSVSLGSAEPVKQEPLSNSREPTAPPPIAPAPILPPVTVPPRHAQLPAPKSGGWSPLVVWIGATLTAAAAGVTTWSGLDTLAARDDYLASPTAAKLDDGRAKQLRTNLLLGATGILGSSTVACALFLVDWKGGARVGAGLGSIQVGGSF